MTRMVERRLARKMRKLILSPRRFVEDSWIGRYFANETSGARHPEEDRTPARGAPPPEAARDVSVPLDLASVTRLAGEMPILVPLVVGSELRREPFDPTRHHAPRVLVAGRPNRWARAAAVCAEHRMEVVAWWDSGNAYDGDTYRKSPVVRGADAASRATVPVLYAHHPKKAEFNSSPPAPETCFWLDPPVGRKLHGPRSPELLTRAGDALERVAAMLEDDASRETLASIVRARLEGSSGFYRIAPYPEYAHPAAAARAGELVIDGGAFDGDSSRTFARQVGPEGRVFALEPSHQSFITLAKSAAAEGLPQIVPLCEGLWSEAGVLAFQDGEGSSSKISSEGTTSIAVVSVDGLVERLGLSRVDVLKLDVEGAERPVLDGARKTLERFRPKLHVSVYHRPDDLHTLPLLLREWLPRYRFWLGHHNFYHTETDLYAVPEERLTH